MNTTEAAYATRLHERLPSPPELQVSCIHVKALGREKKLPFDYWTACFRCVVKAS